MFAKLSSFNFDTLVAMTKHSSAKNQHHSSADIHRKISSRWWLTYQVCVRYRFPLQTGTMIGVDAVGIDQDAVSLRSFPRKDDFSPRLKPDLRLAIDERFHRHVAGQQNSAVSRHRTITATYAAFGDESRAQIAQNGSEAD